MEIDFDGADRLRSDFVCVPEGTYKCIVDEVRIGCTRAGDERWSLSLRVADGPHAGKLAAWDSIIFSGRGKTRARMVFAAMGLHHTGAIELEPADLEGRTAMVTLRTVTYTTPGGGAEVTRNEVPYGGYSAVPK